MPLKSKGYKKNKSFLYGVLSGLIEPISGLITIILLNSVIKIMPYLLSFASGAMFFVVADELIPKYHYNNYSKIGNFYLGIGFIIMMILDISLG
jgi:ZIP family zinc transporter